MSSNDDTEYEFRIHRGAESDFLSLPVDDQDRIMNKLEEMVTNQWRDLRDYDVKPIAGTTHEIFRTRIGNYRVFFVLDGSLVMIVHADQRSGAYRNVDKLD